jgi:hypothetical protein
MRVIALTCFLVVLLSGRSPTVAGNRWSQFLPSNLMQGVPGHALNFVNLRSVWQDLHQYGCLGKVDQRTAEGIVGCFV